jgi:hypothetical protein
VTPAVSAQRPSTRVATLLWAAWACVVWIAIAQSLYMSAFKLPTPVEVAIALRGAVAVVGTLVAAVYLVVGA